MNPKNQNPNILNVRILSPRQLIFEGQALSVSSKNSVGDFDILPYHANFISLIENNVIRIRRIDRQITTFAVPFAILYQSNNNVNIYTDIQFK
jgi:F0F1-type ATP synthase epsilon subunit